MTHWYTSLCKAADRFDGGARSFPLASEADMASRYGYEPPNQDYEMLFFRQASISRSQRDPDAAPHSAGWLVPAPADASVCKPVFIAHSVMSAVWLLHATLAEHGLADTLPADGWECLVRAAGSLIEAGSIEPPSAQQSTASRAKGTKRPAATPAPPPSKRVRGVSTPASGRVIVQRPRVRVTEQQRRLQLGLLAPGPVATAKERGAYRSVAKEDEDTIAWIFERPASDKEGDTFFTSASTPYALACAMLERSRQLGGPAARLSAARFLHDWREHDTLFPAEASSEEIVPLSQSQLLSTDRTFCFAWNMYTRYQKKMEGVYIRSRWASALLGEAYMKKKEQIWRDDAAASNDRTRNRYGKGQVRTQAVAELMRLVYADPTEDQKAAFRRRLKLGARWYKVVTALGWGSLLLMPHELISNSWIEYTLKDNQLHVFLELVQREQPDLCAATRALDEWLGRDAIAGGSIAAKKRLTIEAQAPAAVHKLEEIADSDDDDDEVDDSGSVQAMSTPARMPSEDAAEGVSLVDLGLLDLFKTSTQLSCT